MGEGGDLKPKVQEFLQDLDDDDVIILREGIKQIRAVASAGRIAKWFLLGLFAVVVGASALGEALGKIFHWITGR